MEIYSTPSVTSAGSAPVQKKEPGQETPTTSAGIAAQGGAAPDPSSPSFQVVASSLSQFFPALSGEEIDIKIAQATLQLQEVVGKTNTNELVAKEEQKRESLAERTQKLEEAQAKQEEAEAKQKKGGFLNRLKTAFQFIGAALTVAIGAALIATGAGAAFGAVLVGMGAIQMMMAIDSVVAQETGFGITGNIVKAFGGSDELARGFDIAYQVIATVAIIAVSIMTMRADVLVAEFAKGAALVVGAVTTITSSSVAIKSSVVNNQAANAQADAQDLQADGQDLQAFNELLNDFIDQILNRVSGAATQFNAMLDDISQSVKDRGDTLARANFTG